MSLIDEFRRSLLKAIDTFSQNEGELTKAQAQAVIDLKHLINTMGSPVHLRQEIAIKLRTLPSKTFAFLPFVNDLPKELRRVLAEPLFSEGQLLIAGYSDLRIENKQLREENLLLREEFEKFKKSGLAQDIALILQNLKQENIRLNDTLVQQQQQHQQEIELISIEKNLFQQNVILLTREKEKLQEQFNQTAKEKQELAENFLQKVDENTQLKEENQRLKAALLAYNQEKSDNTGKKMSSGLSQLFQLTN